MTQAQYARHRGKSLVRRRFEVVATAFGFRPRQTI